MENKTIFEKHDCCYFIKEIEEYLKNLFNKKTEWLSKSTDLEKQKSKQEYKNIKKWFSNSFRSLSNIKKQYKQEESVNGKLIQLGAKRFKEEHGEYYGSGFKIQCLNNYLTQVEQLKFKSEKFSIWDNKKTDFFYKHISWSLLNGKTFKQILPNCQKEICFKEIRKNINLFFYSLYPINDRNLYIVLTKQFNKNEHIKQLIKTIIKLLLENKDINLDIKNMNIFFLNVDNQYYIKKIKQRLVVSKINFTELLENKNIILIASFCKGKVFSDLDEIPF